MNQTPALLYVDDEPLNLTLFEINFRKKYTVRTALSGEKGLEILRSEPSIAVVITDMKMPGMNGIEFIRKAKENFPEIVFFILTGYEITGEIIQALEEKLIHKYFKKPFLMKEMETAILEVLK
ncbi:MAG: response regulator [Bacteroidetes bacterium]|jgi:response regulator RpfG family c-di-GMP phosphodiesterase|nr:response regulator [Bacteroidota bacterium]MBS1233748.1 response regulator [Bacteroidota bacterium]